MSGAMVWMVVALTLLGARGDAQRAPRTPYTRPSPIERVQQSAAVVGQYEKLELTVHLRSLYTNPYDPKHIDVVGRFTTPSGQRHKIPGFYYQDFLRSQAADYSEVLTPTKRSAFKLRFAWGEVGTYRYLVTAQDRTGLRVIGQGSFTVQPSANPGFIRRSAAAPHYFATDSGASYFAIGENICWPQQFGTYDYEVWLQKLFEAGGNYTRLWLINEWNLLGLESRSLTAGDGNGLGRYNQRASWRIDYILELARPRSLRIMMSIDSFNTLSTGLYGEWANNPYNKTNGGSCAQPMDFFTNEAAKKLFKQRLRYLVARWVYDTSILSWEFWNEVDLADGYDSTLVTAWHREMADYLRSIDPWQHLLTTSFADPPGDAAVDTLPQLDYVQTHNYGAHDIAGMIDDYSDRKITAYDKPHYLGEFGIDWLPDSYPSDPNGLHLHNAMWASLHSGSAGTAMTWWWDNYIHPNNLYYHFTRLAAYEADINWVGENYAPISPTHVAFAPDSTPIYGAVDITPTGESWEDGSIYNQPHTYEVKNDGTVPEIETMGQVLHGTVNHPTWHNPMTFLVNYPAAGRFEVNIRAVSGWGGAALSILRDGVEVRRQNFPDTDPNSGDTQYQYNGAYGIDVPAGAHSIVVENPGADWCYLDYRLTNYLTLPNLRVMALANATSALVWVQNKEHTWWNQKNGAAPTALSPCLVTLSGFSPGTYRLEQWDTYAGTITNTTTVISADGTLTLTTPSNLTTDTAWKIRAGG